MCTPHWFTIFMLKPGIYIFTITGCYIIDISGNMSHFNVSVPTPLDLGYTCIELVCAVASIIGNVLVIAVFCKYCILRTVTNYYVISLAMADLLVGLVGIPSAIATSMGLPTHFQVSMRLPTHI